VKCLDVNQVDYYSCKVLHNLLTEEQYIVVPIYHIIIRG